MKAQCVEVREALLGGAALAPPLARHAQECVACRDFARALAVAQAHRPAGEPPARLDAAVLAHARATVAPAVAPAPAASGFVLLRWVAFAAAALFLVALGLHAWRTITPPPAPPPTVVQTPPAGDAPAVASHQPPSVDQRPAPQVVAAPAAVPQHLTWDGDVLDDQVFQLQAKLAVTAPSEDLLAMVRESL